MPKIATASKKPSYISLTKFKDTINKQGISITTREIDTSFIQLHLVLQKTDYIYVSTNNSALPVPTNTGITSAHGNNPTITQKRENNCMHKIQLNYYKLYNSTDIRIKISSWMHYRIPTNT